MTAARAAQSTKADNIAQELANRLYGFNHDKDDEGYPTEAIAMETARSGHTITITHEEFREIGKYRHTPKHMYTWVEWCASDYRVVVGFGLETILIGPDAPSTEGNDHG